MNFRQIFLLSLCLLCLPLRMSAGYGDWTIYASYHQPTKIVAFGARLYVLASERLYSYDPSDTSVETYDRTSGLGDNAIFDIVVCEATHQLVVVYQNGNIDLLTYDSHVYNMPELKAKPLNDKVINSTYVEGDNVYIASNAGIVVVDTRRRVFANFYSLGFHVSSVFLDDDGNIMALTKDGIYKGNPTTNLLDTSNWKRVTANRFARIIPFEGVYYALNEQRQVRIITDKNNFSYKTGDNAIFSGYNIVDDKLMFFTKDKILVYDKSHTASTISTPDINYAIHFSGLHWIADAKRGIIGANLSPDGWKELIGPILPNSPDYNRFYRLRNYDGRLLVAAGAFNYSPAVDWEGSIMQYENARWSSFETEGPIEAVGEKTYRNIYDIIQDPLDPSHHYASGASGLYEFKDGKFKKHFSYENSPLQSILPDDSNPMYFVRTTALAFDRSHNLWMINNECDTLVRVLMNNGTWKSYYHEAIKHHTCFDQIILDRRGWAWMTDRRSSDTHNAGIFVWDTNGTMNQTSDDQSRFIYIFRNQDNTSYQVNSLNCVAEDLNGAIWIGTNFGPFVTYQPETVFDNSFFFTQPKVPRNDGTNFADYLMNEVEVKCIAIDGGNRKWMGTLGSGVFLVNEDGSEILEHFTIDNSPLPSNDIYSIAIDGQTGEVFFGSLDGLASYTSNATDPAETFKSDLVKVYPNPVRPDYNGAIIVRGLMANSDVKIVNAAGRLVVQGTSVGGEFTWNGRTTDGRRAASGIYYVLATDAEGTSGVVAKFLVVKD